MRPRGSRWRALVPARRVDPEARPRSARPRSTSSRATPPALSTRTCAGATTTTERREDMRRGLLRMWLWTAWLVLVSVRWFEQQRIGDNDLRVIAEHDVARRRERQDGLSSNESATTTSARCRA